MSKDHCHSKIQDLRVFKTFPHLQYFDIYPPKAASIIEKSRSRSEIGADDRNIEKELYRLHTAREKRVWSPRRLAYQYFL